MNTKGGRAFYLQGDIATQIDEKFNEGLEAYKRKEKRDLTTASPIANSIFPSETFDQITYGCFYSAACSHLLSATAACVNDGVANDDEQSIFNLLHFVYNGSALDQLILAINMRIIIITSKITDLIRFQFYNNYPIVCGCYSGELAIDGIASLMKANFGQHEFGEEMWSMDKCIDYDNDNFLRPKEGSPLKVIDLLIERLGLDFPHIDIIAPKNLGEIAGGGGDESKHAYIIPINYVDRTENISIISYTTDYGHTACIINRPGLPVQITDPTWDKISLTDIEDEKDFFDDMLFNLSGLIIADLWNPSKLRSTNTTTVIEELVQIREDLNKAARGLEMIEYIAPEISEDANDLFSMIDELLPILEEKERIGQDEWEDIEPLYMKIIGLKKDLNKDKLIELFSNNAEMINSIIIDTAALCSMSLTNEYYKDKFGFTMTYITNKPSEIPVETDKYETIKTDEELKNFRKDGCKNRMLHYRRCQAEGIDDIAYKKALKLQGGARISIFMLVLVLLVVLAVVIAVVFAIVHLFGDDFISTKNGEEKRRGNRFSSA